MHILKKSFLFLCSALIFGFCLSHSYAQVFPWDYTWYSGGNKTTPGCGVAGPSRACITKEVACEDIKTIYPSSSYAYVTLTHRTDLFGKTIPEWICNYHYLIPRTIAVEVRCPTGWQKDIFTTRGCVPIQYPKTYGPSCQTAGNPVTICNGNKYEQVTDYKGGGKHPLSFIRYYNSAASYAGDMGIGWRHNFSRSFDILTSTKRTASRETGQEFIFNKSGSNWNPADTNIVLRVAVSGTNFILTDANNVKETYDTNGVLQTIENPDGYIQTLNYTSGQLTSVSDNLGRTLTFTYNADDFLETVTDPDGHVYSYAYIDAYTTPDGAKKLSTVTYPDNTPSPTDNPVVTYLYENTDYPTYLTGITDQLGHRYATWTYDSNGQALSSEHADGADETTIAYNGDGTKTVTQPLGGQTKYTFSVIKNAPMVTREDRLATGSVPAAFQLYTYDGNGFPSSFTDWKGNVTKYTYNTRGLETSRTEAFGTAQARTIGTTWSTAFRLPTQITRTGLTTDMTYDGNGNLLTYVQTDTQTQTIPYSTNGATRQWTYTYDGMGNVLTANGPRTDVTDTTTYDYALTTKNLEKITDALGHETAITSYNGNGLPLSLTDPNGLVINLAYDAQGRLTQYTLKASAGDQVTQIDYDLAGLVTKITASDASTLEYEYDDAQRLVAVENNAAERIEYTLDAAGNIIKEEIKNSGGTIRKKLERQFDEISRLIKDIGAATAQEAAYQYDANGNRTAITDARSNTTA